MNKKCSDTPVSGYTKFTPLQKQTPHGRKIYSPEHRLLDTIAMRARLHSCSNTDDPKKPIGVGHPLNETFTIFG